MKLTVTSRVWALCALLPLAPLQAFTWNPLVRVDPGVDKANQAYAAGKYDQALKGYEDALREHPSAPELQFDRGNALLKLDRQVEAREAYLSALAAKDTTLKSQDYYNMGNALWALDRSAEAAEAYTRALMLDPSFEDARHNLSLLLAPPPDAGQPDAGGKDGGADGGGDGGKDQSKGDGGAQDAGGAQDGGKPKPDSGDGGAPDGGDDKGKRDGGAPPSARRDAGAPPQPQQLDKLKSEQLLDALRQREKNLQMWKFRQKQGKTQEAEKDW